MAAEVKGQRFQIPACCRPAIAALSVAAAIGCAQPAAPTPAPSSTGPTAAPAQELRTVSGTVFVYTSAGAKPSGADELWARVEISEGRLTRGYSIGRIAVDAAGQYSVRVPDGALLRLFTGSVYEQPCAVTVRVLSDVKRDVRLIADRALLGNHLPGEFLAQAGTLTGTVFELAADGTRRPLSGASVVLDATPGLWAPFAQTVTDADGRYLICGLEGETSSFVWALLEAYPYVVFPVALGRDTTLDIEMAK